MAIDLRELELTPRRGYWRVRIGKTIQRVGYERFMCALKGSHEQYERTKAEYGEEHRLTVKAKKTAEFYYNQIDEDLSDVFTLLMFNPTDWGV